MIDALPTTYCEQIITDAYICESLEEGDWRYSIKDISEVKKDLVVVYIDGKFKCWKNLDIKSQPIFSLD